MKREREKLGYGVLIKCVPTVLWMLVLDVGFGCVTLLH